MRAAWVELGQRFVGGCSVGSSGNWKIQKHDPSCPRNVSIIRCFSTQPLGVGQVCTGNILNTGDDIKHEFLEETNTVIGNRSTLSWHDQNFSKMIEELKEFEAKFGSFEIPLYYPPNPMMSKWVSQHVGVSRVAKDMMWTLVPCNHVPMPLIRHTYKMTS